MLNTADGRWFWAIVGADREVMVFERHIVWINFLPRSGCTTPGSSRRASSRRQADPPHSPFTQAEISASAWNTSRQRRRLQSHEVGRKRTDGSLPVLTADRAWLDFADAPGVEIVAVRRA